MKLTPDFDPDFLAPPRPKRRRAQTVRLLLLLTLLTGLTLLSVSVAPARPLVIAQAAVPVRKAKRLKIQQAAPGVRLREVRTQPRDHFVMMASPTIDPEMVHRAPAAIDEGIVVTPRDAQTVPPAPVGPEGAVPQEYFEVPPGTTIPNDEIAPQVPVDPLAPTRPR